MRLATYLLLFYFSPLGPSEAPTSFPAEPEEPVPTKEEEHLQEGVKELRDDVLGLEYYLQDKKDHKKYCLTTKWEQPKIEEYKKEPKSYLPESCKAKLTK